jgi:hypothetical protein
LLCLVETLTGKDTGQLPRLYIGEHCVFPRERRRIRLKTEGANRLAHSERAARSLRTTAASRRRGERWPLSSALGI